MLCNPKGFALADLRRPERGVVAGDVAVRGAEDAMQLDGVVGGERDHRVEPSHGSLRNTRAEDLSEGVADLRCAVQDEPPAHPRRRTVVDLVHERRAEKVGAVDRDCQPEAVGPKRPTSILETSPACEVKQRLARRFRQVARRSAIFRDGNMNTNCTTPSKPLILSLNRHYPSRDRLARLSKWRPRSALLI